jgi:hypothetical protein
MSDKNDVLDGLIWRLRQDFWGSKIPVPRQIVAALAQAYEAGEIAMREKAAGFCNACAEILRPEDREGAKWIGRKIAELVLSGAAPEEKKSPGESAE